MADEGNECRRRLGVKLENRAMDTDEVSWLGWQQTAVGKADRLRLADGTIRNSRSGGPGDRPSYGMVDRSLGSKCCSLYFERETMW